ncbi:cation diffusion facilitator family transporter [Marininema halotolerans]|uniref:Cobalt-zinc-cadmium efflux system protein n=1 Tax=Marininema halotolerans TaxID=1155944 RepID=A0A1I6TJ19_9BACL|nr:cation diffusion facilitator family transporter [Marininema halotolerans]SFS89170.1 cobalt-zinc-cadmium efflux system protein [Marininema halotolerans]
MHQHHGQDQQGASFTEQREGNRKGLIIALTITTGIMIMEFVGGWIINSLALLSDAGHMLSDVASMVLGLVAMGFANRPTTSQKTYGLYRFEILAAMFNAITLFIIAAVILWEAVDRFRKPPEVAGGTMVILAAIGLVANVTSAWFLLRKGDVKENVNLKGVYLHVIGDALGSAGAFVAGLLMIFFSWYIADPIISVLVSLLILKSAYGVLKQSIHILMEGTPSSINEEKVRETLLGISGVMDVHDLHIWTITSGMDTLTCHLQIKDDHDGQQVLQAAIHKIEEDFGIHHTTIQVEKSDLQHRDLWV